ncbi:D-alanine aminotransferase [Seongchinamella sediminis]|uniref:Aminodeoxychorismate lyase n=1 Tax=Seongchinamella sediminis TaxID=2283635 RepID=A0A3L7DZS0_9GAMM|nr:aminotransferase class IV [Seongchinamella sediminis]RLQ21633.1 D-alanine aminotransferase [Seongchinamella sediminis]
MSIVYLNGDYMPMEEARISPMDRGFLFGDGIYEVVPSYDGRLVGLTPHLERMQEGLDAIEIKLKVDHSAWRNIAGQLIERNGGGNLGIYFHVSRGADSKRHHAYPDNIAPTLYAFAFDIPPAPRPEKSAASPYTVSTAEDLRWRRCNIKSTALLGNVMHYQHGHSRGHSETILYNQQGEITEAAACNVFVIKNGIVATPLLDHQKLPGITRLMLLEILRRDGSIPVHERVVKLAELEDADEVWITSSSKEIAPVIEIDGRPVGNGEIGDVWLAAQGLYTEHKFDF